MKHYIPVLSIAGSDCSGGAGIQADLKTISALGSYAATAITAVTVQNTCGVRAIHPVPADIIKGQIQAVMEDIRPLAVKIGMVNDTQTVGAITSVLKKYDPAHTVYDPVMVSTSGHKLMQDETIETIRKSLIPLAGLITIKGGHLEGNDMCDVLCIKGENTPYIYTASKISSKNTHGTGCTLSSAIATFLAIGNSMEESVRKAKEYVHSCIREGRDLRIGHGYGPLWHFPAKEERQ